MSRYVWVAHAGEDTLGLWEVEPLREIGRIDVAAQSGIKGLGLRRLAWDPLRGRLYVSCTYANCVGVVDVKRKEWVETVYVGAAPTDICICNDRILVCCCESESLWALDRGTPSAVGCVQLPGFPYSMDNSNHRLLLCCMSRPAVWSMDETLNVADVLPLQNAPMCATKLPDGDMLITLLPYNSDKNGRLVRMDVRTGTISRALDMGMMPGIVRLSPDNTLAVAVNMSESEVFLLEPETFVVQKRQTGAMPDDVLFLPEGTGMLVSCMLEEKIVHFDMQGKMVRSAQTGKEPRGMALCEI
ncbi:MAG: YncE family protein [Bacillota bacterium]